MFWWTIFYIKYTYNYFTKSVSSLSNSKSNNYKNNKKHVNNNDNNNNHNNNRGRRNGKYISSLMDVLSYSVLI